MRTLAAFESSLRGMHFGESLRAGQLEFHRQGGVVEATMCLIGDTVEVVVKGPVGSDNKAVEVEQESAQYTARNSDARQDRAFESSGDAAQAGSAAEPQDKSGGDAAQVGSATAEPQDKSDGDAAQVGSAIAEPQDKSGGDAAQVGSAVAEPQNSGQARSWADIGHNDQVSQGQSPSQITLISVIIVELQNQRLCTIRLCGHNDFTHTVCVSSARRIYSVQDATESVALLFRIPAAAGLHSAPALKKCVGALGNT